ncbi:pathogen-associated molecular patterns-induced protein A70 [Hevea brasiliensis]|uniref:pathogen-associated molecular patterns-induced protein A70 n=1 Tax=Hevea brasiliensis TaxID=3981 RepID=UPI0025E3505D|nr:pathogen-associated molecular patterns-induced protein A70 [Hevea brasiliensis]
MADPASPASMWGFATGWFTPANLFLFVNLVIGTIALTSRFGSNRRQHQEEIQPLARTPSLLERVKSINFSFYNYPLPDSEPQVEPTTDSVHDTEPVCTTEVHTVQLERAPSLLERVKSIKLSSFYRSEPETEIVAEADSDPDVDTGHASSVEGKHQVKRSKSEPREASEKKAPEKMKKSASEREVVVEEDRERVERRRPATTRIEKTASFGDEGVDAKADDFINRFKQQLRLQRLDSLLRYRDMLNGK